MRAEETALKQTQCIIRKKGKIIAVITVLFFKS